MFLRTTGWRVGLNMGKIWPCVFSKHLLQRRHIQHRLRQELLELAVLLFQALQLAGVGDLHPAIARPPLVERRIADAVLPTQVARRHPGGGGRNQRLRAGEYRADLQAIELTGLSTLATAKRLDAACVEHHELVDLSTFPIIA